MEQRAKMESKIQAAEKLKEQKEAGDAKMTAKKEAAERARAEQKAKMEAQQRAKEEKAKAAKDEAAEKARAEERAKMEAKIKEAEKKMAEQKAREATDAKLIAKKAAEARAKKEERAKKAATDKAKAEQRAKMEAKIESVEKKIEAKEQASAATKVQSHIRARNAKAEVEKRAAARDEDEKAAAHAAKRQQRSNVEREKEETQAAIRLQTRTRSHLAKEYTRLLAKDKRETEAAVVVQSRVRAVQAKPEIEMAKVERAAREKRRQEQQEVARALQAIVRVRRAREQKKRMQKAAELAVALGISKWAALWMMKEQDDANAQDDAQDPPSLEDRGAWSRVTTGSLPEPSSPAVDEDALLAELEAELALDASPMKEDWDTVEVDREVDRVLAELEEQAARREAERLEQLEKQARKRAAKARHHWSLLRKGLKVALRVEYQALGMDPKEDPATRFARIVKEKLAALTKFRAENPDYPFGPLPEVISAPLASPRLSSSTSPRRSRLPSAKLTRPEQASTVALGTTVVPMDMPRPLSGSALRRSSSEATLPERPSTAGLKLGSGTLRTSTSTIRLVPVDEEVQYGEPSHATSAPLPARQQMPSRSADVAELGIASPRQPPSLGWSSSPIKETSPPGAVADGVPAVDLKGSPDTMPVEENGEDAFLFRRPQRNFGRANLEDLQIESLSRPGSAAALPPQTLRVVERFQTEVPQYPALLPMRASSSSTSLSRSGGGSLPSRNSSAGFARKGGFLGDPISSSEQSRIGSAGGVCEGGLIGDPISTEHIRQPSASKSRGRPPKVGSMQALPPEAEPAAFTAPPRAPSAERRPERRTLVAPAVVPQLVPAADRPQPQLVPATERHQIAALRSAVVANTLRPSATSANLRPSTAGTALRSAAQLRPSASFGQLHDHRSSEHGQRAEGDQRLQPGPAPPPAALEAFASPFVVRDFMCGPSPFKSGPAARDRTIVDSRPISAASFGAEPFAARLGSLLEARWPEDDESAPYRMRYGDAPSQERARPRRTSPGSAPPGSDRKGADPSAEQPEGPKRKARPSTPVYYVNMG